ncbi:MULTISPECIES: hypothetical protein [Bacillota]|jgi:hypothetical protein|uniref:Uncharacterized protein n=1 Tax=Enterocloster clostridioformis TaxID=1531 RepID=A0A174V3E6_9FIRM|nr:hypothetical protein [Enterocloster clostridioformis]CUQ26550.1 Uncharacterised protein [Enterocloster clostridioformis]
MRKRIISLLMASIFCMFSIVPAFAAEISPISAQESSQAEAVTPRATTIPTELCTQYPFTGDWSNTVNYTYTKYYFQPGWIKVESDQPFSLYLYDVDHQNGFLGYDATYKDGKYRYNLEARNFKFWVKITNTGSSPATNAYYTVTKN